MCQLACQLNASSLKQSQGALAVPTVNDGEDVDDTGSDEDLLKEKHQDGDEGGSLLFQSVERARRSHEEFGVAVRHVVLETMLGDDGLNSLPVRGHQVVRPGVLAGHLIPAEHLEGQEEEEYGIVQ